MYDAERSQRRADRLARPPLEAPPVTEASQESPLFCRVGPPPPPSPFPLRPDDINRERRKVSGRARARLSFQDEKCFVRTCDVQPVVTNRERRNDGSVVLCQARPKSVCRFTTPAEPLQVVETMEQRMTCFVRSLGAVETRTCRHLILFRRPAVMGDGDLEPRCCVHLIVRARFNTIVQYFLESRPDGDAPSSSTDMGLAAEGLFSFPETPCVFSVPPRMSRLTGKHRTYPMSKSEDLYLNLSRSSLSWAAYELKWKPCVASLRSIIVEGIGDEITGKGGGAKAKERKNDVNAMLGLLGKLGKPSDGVDVVGGAPPPYEFALGEDDLRGLLLGGADDDELREVFDVVEPALDDDDEPRLDPGVAVDESSGNSDEEEEVKVEEKEEN